MKRRNFIQMTCLSCIGGATVISSLQSCSSSLYVNGVYNKNQIEVKKADFITLKNGKELVRNYVLVKHDTLPFPICIYKTGNDTYTALLMECTHQGCELNAYQNQLVCPCHGSEFDIKGAVLNGPADIPLKQFDIITNETTIYIKIA
jgi:cytochrome b6-f complex iron-sulfur subunit